MKNWKKIAKQQAETIAELNMELGYSEQAIEDNRNTVKELEDKLNAIIDIVGYKPIKFNYPNFGSGSVTTTGGKYFYTINNAMLPSEGYK